MKIPKYGEQDIVRAFQCALAILRKEGGGYSPAEQQKAIDVIQNLLDEVLRKL